MNYEDYTGTGEEMEALRSSLSRSDHDAGIARFVQIQLNSLDAALAQIIVEAQIEADLYWSVVKSSRDDYTGWDSFCRIGTRITVKGGSFSAEWYRNRYAPNPGGPAKIVYSTYLRKGKGYSYPMSIFSREPDWVQTQVAATEAQYAKLRERAAALTKIRTAVKVYERLYNKVKS